MLVYAKDVTQTKSSRSAVNIILASGNFNEGVNIPSSKIF